MSTLADLWQRLGRLSRRMQLFFANDLVVAVVGLSCLFGGVFIRHAHWPGGFNDGLGALCDALVIAAILKLTVDPILKRELERNAAEDVFSYIFGYSLPPQLRLFVNDLILETKIARSQCRLHWHIAPKSGSPTRVEVTLEASFFIINFSGSGSPYRHAVYSWKEDDQDVGCVRAMYCVAKNPKKSYRNDTPEALTMDPDGFIRGTRIVLPAHTKDDEYNVGAVYYSEAGSPGLDQFTIMEPTLEIEARVTIDDKLQGLVFSLTPDLSESKEVENYVPLERHPESKLLEYTWTLERVFVPNETVMIRWKKQEPKPPRFSVLE